MDIIIKLILTFIILICIIILQKLVTHLNGLILCPVKFHGRIFYIENKFAIKYKICKFQDIRSELADKLRNDNAKIYFSLF